VGGPAGVARGTADRGGSSHGWLRPGRLACLTGVGPAAAEIPATDRGTTDPALVLLVHVQGLALDDPPARLAQLPGRHGDDHLVVDPVAQPADEGVPHGHPLLVGDGTGGHLGVDAVHEQDLGPVHVAHAGDDGLIHQGEADRRRSPPDLGPRPLGIAARVQGIGAEAGQDGVDPGRVDQGALRRPDEVGGRGRAGEAHPDRLTGHGCRHGMDEEAAEQPEVHVDDVTAGPVVEQVLAMRPDPLHLPAVEPPGRGREPALGRRDPQVMAGEQGGVVPG
jgi:hypothetical protein